LGLGWSDRPGTLVKPAHIAGSATGNPVKPAGANFGRQHMPSYFLVKLECEKNILADQNYLRAMINSASVIPRSYSR